MIKYLSNNGFVKVSQNGSYIKMRNDITNKQTIIIYYSNSLEKGLENALLKQEGFK